MRAFGVCGLLGALALVGGASSATAPGRTTALPSPVRALAADGYGAAVLLGPPTACHVVAWDARTGRKTTIRRRCVGSNRDSTLAVARAGSRVAWVETAGGNLLEEYIDVASPARRKPLMVAFLGSGPDIDGDYVGELKGAGRYLFFTQFHRCVPADPDEPPNACPTRGAVDRSKLWSYDPLRRGEQCPSAARVLRCRLLRSSRTRLTLLWASATRLLVRLNGEPGGGPVALLSAAGSSLNVYHVPGVSDAALAGRTVLLRHATVVDVYDAVTGARLRSFAAPGALVGAAGGAAYFLRGRTISRLRLTDGRGTSIVAPGRGAVHAAVSARGLFYSFTAGGKAHLRFRPQA